MKLSLRIAAVAGLLATPAMAEDFAVPIDLGKKAAIELVIEKSGSAGGQPVKAIFRYRQDIAAIKDGYRVTQTLTSVGGDATDKSLESAVSVSKLLVYETDESLSPTRILNLPDILARTREALGQMSGLDAAQLDRGMAPLRALSPEAAAVAFLKEQVVVASLQMAGLDLGKPVEEKSQVGNPLGGPPIDQVIRAELKSLDKKSGVAVIDYRAALDPASTRKSLQAAIKDYSSVEAAGFTIENTMTCRYEMSLKTGLTNRVTCDHHAVAGDGKDKTARDEHWVITQTLVKP